MKMHKEKEEDEEKKKIKEECVAEGGVAAGLPWSKTLWHRGGRGGYS